MSNIVSVYDIQLPTGIFHEEVRIVRLERINSPPEVHFEFLLGVNEHGEGGGGRPSATRCAQIRPRGGGQPRARRSAGNFRR